MQETPIIQTLNKLLDIKIPQQFLGLSALNYLQTECSNLGLPEPRIFAGNIVIGELSDAQILLSAHMDEASFNVSNIEKDMVALAPCHRYIASNNNISIDIIGIRNETVTNLGTFKLESNADGQPYCLAQGIRLGDRAVYSGKPSIEDNILSCRALDDRVGAAIALHAFSSLHQKGIKVALVLSDEEQNLPDGYFSRTFPHVLNHLRKECIILFIDGIFLPFAPDRTELLNQALLVPHSGNGKGYTVPPLLFSRLRDNIIPIAQSAGIETDICELYHSRGDDWGMVTNPTVGHQFSAFFISFLGWGETPALRKICIKSLNNCVEMTKLSVIKLLKNKF